MPTKGERTRQMIVQRSAELFNTYGYSGTSLSDIIEHTGIQKGGIYRYFNGKEQIAAEAFAYAIDMRVRQIRDIIYSDTDAVERLTTISRTLLDIDTPPVITGGCPIMNAAIEADDGLPELASVRAEAEHGMTTLLGGVRRVVTQGIEGGELSPNIDPDGVASVLVSTCEGAIMLAKLQHNNAHRERVLSHLADYLVGLRLPDRS
jgi:AcrR family transcriptional regulator